MSKVLVPWFATLLVGGGLGLTFVYPAVGVGIASVASVAAAFMSFGRNVPLARLGVYVAASLFAGALWVGTGDYLLAAGAALILVAVPTNEVLSRISPYMMSIFVLLAVAAGLVLFAFANDAGWWYLAVVPHVLTGLLGVHFSITGIQNTAKFGVATGSPLKVGAQMPEMTLPHREGDGIWDLSEQRGRPVLLCFLRGDWCPVCQVMMRVFRAEAPQLKEHDVELVMINPSGGQDAAELAKDMGLNYTILRDDKAAVAEAWGLVEKQKRNDEPVPAPVSLLVDAEGVLKYVSKPHDFTPFQTPSRMLQILNATSSA